MSDVSPTLTHEVLDPWNLHMELIWANERVVEPRFQHMRFEVRDESTCWGIHSGRVQVRLQNQSRSAESGDWLFPGSGHPEVDFKPGTRITSIRFRLLHREGVRVFPQPEPLLIRGEDAEELAVAARPLIRRVEAWPSGGSLLMGRDRIPLADNLDIEAAFLHWLSVYSQVMRRCGQKMRPRRDRDERVMQALDLLERHNLREPFREEALAAECGIGVRHLRRLFQEEVGQSPRDLYQKRRLELARHTVRETVLPFKEIAFELGFRAPPHFTHWFRKLEGVSPREFRGHGK